MENLQIIKTTINIGIEKPVKVLHITDTHLTLNDSGEPDLSRHFKFNTETEEKAIPYYMQAIAYAKENNLPLLHTGDMLDFLSDGNFSFLEKHLNDMDYMYAAGNHDFCHCVGEATEDYAYKWEQMKRIAPHIKSNLYFDSRIIGGVNFVTLDNSYYLMTKGQEELLQAEAAKGYPIILAMHIPLYTPKMAEIIINERSKSGVASMMGAPEEILATYPEFRRVQQSPDAETLHMIDYIKNEPLIKALIVGHTHINFEEQVTENMMQYATHSTYAGFAREITII